METKENINFIFRLDNQNRSGNYFFAFIASGIIASGIGITFAALGMYLGIIIDVVIAAVYFFFFTRMNPSFFEMLVTENSLQVNYYSLASTFRNYKSIEIPLYQFRDFKLESKYKNLKKTLTLSVQSKYGIADYPPISVSILSTNELAQVVHVLQEILKSQGN